MTQELPQKTAQDRSPRFPSSTLSEALEYVSKLFAGLGRSAAPAEALAKALGYSALSGSARSALATLAYYGLTHRDGINHRVSDLALRIIRPVSEADKTAAMQQAALTPPLFAQLQKENPDTSETLLATLLLHRGFTEDGSARAAKVFRDNLAFIGQLPTVSSAGNIPQPSPAPEANPPLRSDTQPKTMTQTIAVNELPVPIGDNLVARVPFPMTEDDFDLLVGTLNLWKKKLTRKPEANPPSDPQAQI
jgi:hypothetical protein